MYIVVVGAGAAGFYVASLLSKEKQDIVVVEQDAEVAEQVRRQLDVGVVVGNGAIPRVLREAEAQRADLVVALTAIDEVNMVTCFMAKELGAKKTIARVREPEYSSYQLVGSKSPYASRKIVRLRGLGVDLFVNPEIEAAREIVSILSGLYVTPMWEFADSRVQMREFRVENPTVLGKTIATIPFPRRCVAAMLGHGDSLHVPSADEVLQKGDRLYLMAEREDMDELGDLFDVPRRKNRMVAIFGAGIVGYNVAVALEKRGVQVKVIEKSALRTQQLSMKLKRSVVVQGGRPDRELLAEEGIGQADAFIAATGDESLNILAGLVAKNVGASRSIVLVDKPEYIPLAEAVGVDVPVSPLIQCGETVVRYILHAGGVSVALLGEEDAQVIEFMVGSSAKINKQTVSQVEWPRGSKVTAIVRGDLVMIPPDAAVIEPNDRVIVASTLEAVPAVERLFR